MRIKTITKTFKNADEAIKFRDSFKNRLGDVCLYISSKGYVVKIFIAE